MQTPNPALQPTAGAVAVPRDILVSRPPLRLNFTVRRELPMEIREDDNVLEILHLETSPTGTPAAGDLRLSLRVSSAGFSGLSESVWTDCESYRSFLAALSLVERNRNGVARLDALGSPDECWLEVRALDRSGHMAVFGRISCWSTLNNRSEGFHRAVEFGFEFCPSKLPEILAEFRCFAETATA